MIPDNTYYKYWGKAKKKEDGAFDCHLLAWHCLDVAAVGRVWLEQDQALRRRVAYTLGIDDDIKFFEILGLFFSLHDFGKFDIRFQSKLPEVRTAIWTDLCKNDLLMSEAQISEFDHGKAGYDIFVKQNRLLFEPDNMNDDLLDIWKIWIATVTGHHGIIPKNSDWHNPCVESIVKEHDKHARKEWFQSMVRLFCHNNYDIPVLSEDGQAFIAGFCSISDWIASNELFVRWIDNAMPLDEYFASAIEHCRHTNVLKQFGIVGQQAAPYQGIGALLQKNNSPRQIQTLIDDLPSETGLTIIEGTTGSGKTEAALSLAWKLIDSGQADSIVFALPTQATANAMLDRLQILAAIVFANGDPNLVLAHGKAKYNKVFANLKAAGKFGAKQSDQGSVQCAEWISSSRKLVFLGQIGVCTIDQALLSVLPVRHNFIRSFGIMKSILIVDEVHAYDRYMYGLLEAVLRHQKKAGGSAILLSATLPAVQKKELFESWQKDSSKLIDANAPYPLISGLTKNGLVVMHTVHKKDLPPEREVRTEVVSSKSMEPTVDLFDSIQSAARSGVTIAVVCNLVQSAQRIARELREQNKIPIDIFHARYRFKDRQSKEAITKAMYGKDAPRVTGRILVATQVVEQSLDLDFDWLITQLCPVDLLFQRMGRLHRHERKRPSGFEKPICTILANDGDDFGAHEIIYGDARVLWRTREMLRTSNGKILFPEAYRDWIEAIYGREDWEGGTEPDCVIGRSCAFRQEQTQQWNSAKTIAATGMVPFADTDRNSSSLTRGKEMGLNIVPILAGQEQKTLLDGECRTNVNSFEWDECLNMNSISVPASWNVWLPCFEEDYIFLPMVADKDGWVWRNGNNILRYSTDYGLEKMEVKE